MFKPNCGRKLESVVWEYFVYDAACDKSRCNVSTRDCGDDDAVKHAVEWKECYKLNEPFAMRPQRCVQRYGAEKNCVPEIERALILNVVFF